MRKGFLFGEIIFIFAKRTLLSLKLIIRIMFGGIRNFKTEVKRYISIQGCGNTMPNLCDLVPFHSGQVENFNLLVLGQVRNLL